MKSIEKKLPLNKVIYDGWKLEEIYPYKSQFIFALQFSKIGIKEKIILSTGCPSSENHKPVFYSDGFNLYRVGVYGNKSYQISDNLVNTLARYTGKMLLKIPALKTLLESYNKINTEKSFITSLKQKSKSTFVPKKHSLRKNELHYLWISSPCKYNCIFCSLKDIDKAKDLSEQQLNYFKNEIKKGREIGNNKLLITGYEILNYKDVLDIIRYAKDIGYEKLEIYTTGIKLADKKLSHMLVNILGKNFLIHLPLYGHTAKLHDSITKLKGSFKQLTSGINNLLNYCTPDNIEISTVALKQNYKHIAKIKDFIQNFRINTLTCRFPYPVTESKDDRYKFVVEKLTKIIPFIFSCSPKILVDIYPCILFKYLQKNETHLSSEKINIILNQMPFLFNVKVAVASKKIEKGLALYNSDTTILCPYNNKCVLASYCSKRIFRKYLQIFGNEEFYCVKEEILKEFKSKSNLL